MQENWKKNVAIFIGCQALSLFGSSLVQYAIVWHITLSTKSGLYTTFSILCGFLPTLFLSPFGGVWADRYNRKRLIMLADGGIALCTLVLAILFATGHDYIWLLFVASAIRALGSAIQTPAINALLPDLAPVSELTKINGLNGSIQSVITLLSPMLGGALLSLASLTAVFMVDVVTAAAAIFIMLVFLKMPVQKHVEQNRGGRYLEQLKEGFRYVGAQKYLRSFFLFCGIFYLLIGPLAFLTPLQVARSYGDDVWRLSAIEVAFSVGMALGGLGMAAWGGFRNRTHTMGLGFIAAGAITVAFGMGVPFVAYVILMGLSGFTVPAFNTPAMVLLQERVEGGMLGRVFGVLSMLNSSLMPISMLLYGPLADVLPIEWMLLVTGALMIATAYFLFRNKPLLEAGLPISAE